MLSLCTGDSRQHSSRQGGGGGGGGGGASGGGNDEDGDTLNRALRKAIESGDTDLVGVLPFNWCLSPPVVSIMSYMLKTLHPITFSSHTNTFTPITFCHSHHSHLSTRCMLSCSTSLRTAAFRSSGPLSAHGHWQGTYSSSSVGPGCVILNRTICKMPDQDLLST